MLDYAYGLLVAVAAFIALLLLSSLTFHTIERIRDRRERNTRWIPDTRTVGNQTWVVVQLIHFGWLGNQQVVAEQLIGAIPNNLSDYDHQLQRSEHIAELRATWLNSGEPHTPDI